MLGDFYKEKEADAVWWVDDFNSVGKHLFSFDKRKIYNLFADYPYNMTAEEVAIFSKENPYWREFFQDRFVDKDGGDK
ncbi:hypothetical protein GTO87_05170 [Ligilactobacillus saerimneri]|uniref:DUF7675 domain-containing protein n=1 Tax=Ligilactobacillus saerimneri TaxID=228229 RepID=A0A7H9EL02_9LACO|nr:hypothetical protein [Ligilactobacillus saerimneri]QLL78049.1 hypothetical protein GTO87_05170 [Ligilactobacillus saerimneri]